MKTWRDIEELSDRAALAQIIEEEGTPARIARRLGCSKSSVKNAMVFHGLKSKNWKAGEEIKKRLDL